MDRKRINQLKILVLVSIVIGVPFIMCLVRWISINRTTCIFNALGFECLGCNMLQALEQVKQGNWIKAFDENPLVYIWIGLGMLIMVSELYAFVRRIGNKKYTKDSLLEWFLKKMFRGYE